MKTNKFKLLLISSFLALFFVACESDDNVVVEVPKVSTGVFVLNQGKWHENNSSLSYYDFTTKTTTADIFSAANDKVLGDGGQDALLYGSNLYITVTESSVLEIIDPKTGFSKKSISLTNGDAPRKPRSMAALNGKIFITLFDGNVAKFDTTTLAVEAILPVGPNPEGIVAVNNLLYVAISGGRAAVKDSTIAVIDPVTFTALRSITVGVNPNQLIADSQGDVYVFVKGDYTPSNLPALKRIVAGTEVVSTLSITEPKNITIDKDQIYVCTFDYDANYQAVNSRIFKLDALTEMISTSSLIADKAIAKTPYSLDIDPTNGDIYIAETDYKNAGKMYVFAKDGAIKASFNVGLNASKTIFTTNK